VRGFDDDAHSVGIFLLQESMIEMVVHDRRKAPGTEEWFKGSVVRFLVA
jgi:hypothetical protein